MNCKFAYCRNEERARGYCRGHYTQLLRGQELRPLREKKSVEQQILDEIAKEDSLLEDDLEDEKVAEVKITYVPTPDEVSRAWRNRLRPNRNK